MKSVRVRVRTCRGVVFHFPRTYFAASLLPRTAEVDGKIPPSLPPRQPFNMDPSRQDRDVFGLCVGWKSTEPGLICKEE